MKKKILSVMLAAGLVVTSLAACGGSDQAEAPATDEPAATEEPQLRSLQQRTSITAQARSRFGLLIT